MFDFLSTVGLCKKSHRFVAFVVACIAIIVAVSISSIVAIIVIEKLSTYKEIVINLFNIITIEAR